MSDVEQQLEAAEKRHTVQTEYMKSISSTVKQEQVTSLKQELHRTFQDKVDIQMYAQEVEEKCQELEEKCSENEGELENLQKKNAKLQGHMKEKDRQLKALSEKLMRRDVRRKKKKAESSGASQ